MLEIRDHCKSFPSISTVSKHETKYIESFLITQEFVNRIVLVQINERLYMII